jgi:hypothetical protein
MACAHHNVLNPLIGVSTPVIDPGSGTMYVDVFTGPIANTNSGYHVLHALNITNGRNNLAGRFWLPLQTHRPRQHRWHDVLFPACI